MMGLLSVIARQQGMHKIMLTVMDANDAAVRLPDLISSRQHTAGMICEGLPACGPGCDCLVGLFIFTSHDGGSKSQHRHSTQSVSLHGQACFCFAKATSHSLCWMSVRDGVQPAGLIMQE